MKLNRVLAGFMAGATLTFGATTLLDDGVVTRGCVIRFDTLSESGVSVVPRIHANSTHTCKGIESVAADWSGSDRGDLVVTASDGLTNVITIGAEEDETLTSRDIFCGPSGGGETTRFRCFRDGVKVEVQSLDMYGPTANLWLHWEMQS